MEIHNLTAQTVAIVNEEGALVASYPPEEGASYEKKLVREGVVDGVIIYREKFRNIQLPEYDPDKLYIVDDEMAVAARDYRTDLLIPIDPVEDGEGGSNAYKGFVILQD